MTGGIIQLVAYGKEDLFLSNDPQITFFKITYRRHTNFSREDVSHRFLNEPDFGKFISSNIPKGADIINNASLKITIPSIPKSSNPNVKYAWVKKLGFAIIDYIDIEIDGKIIDRHYGEWMNIWAELTTRNIEDNSIDKLIGNIPELIQFTHSKDSYTLYVPIYLWFCRHSGLGLPMIALKYSNIKINVKLAELDDLLMISPNKAIQCSQDDVCFNNNELLFQNNTQKSFGIFNSYDPCDKKLFYFSLTTPFKINEIDNTNIYDWITNNKSSTKIISNPIIGTSTKYSLDPESNSTTIKNTIDLNITDMVLLLDHVYVDTQERIFLSKIKHDYLIEQLYYTPNQNVLSNNERFRLNINNPCKLTIYLCQLDSISKYDKFNYTDNFDFDYLNIQSINNLDDFHKNNRNNNSLINTNQILLNSQQRIAKKNNLYFENIQPFQHTFNRLPKGVGMYSYALFPTKVEPSGTSNMTNIEYIDLMLELSDKINENNKAKLRSYSLTYQIWRVNNGLSGELFINQL
jgi:hypothetical protein